MNLLDYTTTADIRAVLGVTDNELSDTTLALEVYSSNLLTELEDIDVGVPDQYTVVVAILAASRTADQTRFYTAARMFATYAIAKQLGSSLPMFAPKAVGDSKTTGERFGADPYKETMKGILQSYSNNRSRLAKLYSVLVSTADASPRVFMVVSQPSTDPVTSN